MDEKWGLRQGLGLSGDGVLQGQGESVEETEGCDRSGRKERRREGVENGATVERRAL